MRFSLLVDAYERIAATTKRLEMTDLLVALFRDVPRAEIGRVVYVTQGRVAPDYAGVELGLAEKLVIRAIALATGRQDGTISAAWKASGDLGTVSEDLLRTKKQASLVREPLTVAKVHGNLTEIATTSGEGSQERKIRLLAELLTDAAPTEAKYIARMVVGKMRLGVADMTIVDALAATFASKEQRALVERAYNVSSDLGEVAELLASEGLEGLRSIRLRLFRPVRAMLAERLETLESIFERLGTCGLEYKYDGLRVQAHVSKDRIELYSRQLEHITGQFPEIVEGLRTAVRAKEAILEGEAVPVDANTGEFLPFQEVSRRRGRKTDVERMAKEFPVSLFAFDCLLRDGDDLTTRGYRERRRILESVLRETDTVRHATWRVTSDAKEGEAFFEEALQAGCEGLMAKALDSTYDAGARGFQWIKFKKEYSAELSDTIDLVVVGAFAGRGKRAGTYGALLMAAYDAPADVFRTTCKLGTGFDDVTLSGLPERLADVRVDGRHARVDSKLTPDVWFEPRAVLEVRGAEITVSPVHTCAWGAVREGAGLAVRFPRFTGRWREDKGPEDATTAKELLDMYRMQARRTRTAGEAA
ncbi:MAG: ATP-dependent DNA ligase [Methanobacteriota archaeon]